MSQSRTEKNEKDRLIVRRLMLSEGATALGDGLWFSMWAVYLTSIQGIPAATMGLAMGLGGGLGLLAALPVGNLADRFGSRETLVVVSVLRAGFSLTFLATHSFWPLLFAAALFTSMETAAKGSKVALVYLLVSERDCLPVLARLRVMQHLLYAVGAGAAAWVLARQTATPYHAAVVVNGLTFLVSAAILIRLPHVPPVPATRRPISTEALRNVPFMAIMGSTALLALCWALLSSGLPLWLKEGTAAPVWIAPLSVLVSSLLIALFQVRVSRAGQRLVGAVRSSWRASFALAGCCLVFAAAAWPASPVMAAAIVLAGLGLHVLGELYYVAARWGLSIKLMSHGAQGQYQAVAATTEGAVVAVGPALVVTLVSGGGGVGWGMLALVFLASSLPVAPLCRRALRHTAPRAVKEGTG
ncbi:MFS transporter [Streptomyces sp. SID7982]|nr:MFS transporter [Streptomyces sp. SID7982]